jgi:hypothetical protein
MSNSLLVVLLQLLQALAEALAVLEVHVSLLAALLASSS